jgi:hypothetical protein
MNHPTVEQLDRWRRGDVAEDEVLAIGRHLAACSECTALSAEHLGLDDAANAMLDDIEQSAEEPRRVWPLLLAAAVVIAVVAPILLRKEAPPPRTLSHPPPIVVRLDPWSKLVERVRQGEAIGEPDVLRSVRAEGDVLRGTAGAEQTFAPSGVVVKSTRPAFRWPAAKGAMSQVQVFDRDVEVADSGVLRGSQWSPEHDLERGTTYTWTVRVERDGVATILPASPLPVARFRVLDAATLADLDAAEQEHPDDHLLLGIVNARAGLIAEAKEHLRQVNSPGDVDVARRITRDIDSWSR